MTRQERKAATKALHDCGLKATKENMAKVEIKIGEFTGRKYAWLFINNGCFASYDVETLKDNFASEEE